jgi:hypothetical protein
VASCSVVADGAEAKVRHYEGDATSGFFPGQIASDALRIAADFRLLGGEARARAAIAYFKLKRTTQADEARSEAIEDLSKIGEGKLSPEGTLKATQLKDLVGAGMFYIDGQASDVLARLDGS